LKLRIQSGGLADIYRHLAVEESLLDETSQDRVELYFYQSQPAVVLGKNQVPWKECRPGWLDRNGIRLARRASGGGAVYHDPGNLNVSFVMPRSVYDTGKVMRVFLDALGSLGIWAACPERSRLVWNDAKISGQAFAYRRDRVLHHGTLLLQSDLSALKEALISCDGLFESSAVASKPSPVANLNFPVKQVEEAVIAAAERVFGLESEPGGSPGMLLGMGDDWDWVFGRTPDFTWRKLAPGSNDPVMLRIEKGRVTFCARGRDIGLPLSQAGVRLDRSAWNDFTANLTPGLWSWVPALFSGDELPGPH
jgi:lipoate-protein ligase A